MIRLLVVACLYLVFGAVNVAAATYSPTTLLPSTPFPGAKEWTDFPCAPLAGGSTPLLIQVYQGTESGSTYLNSIQTIYNTSGTVCDGKVWGTPVGTRLSCVVPPGQNITSVMVYFNEPKGTIWQLTLTYTNRA
jgi:hypothetical protein